MKILIIDDQQLVLLSLEKSLHDLGYEVITAATVAEAIEKFDIYSPSLVIVDINLSGEELNIENSGQYFVKVYSENNCVAQSNLLLSKVTATEQERLANQTRIYPNPAQNKFFVETENLNISQINIYNNLGQKVGIFFVKNTKLIELSLENYSQGLYLLEILSNEGRFAKSLLILTGLLAPFCLMVILHSTLPRCSPSFKIFLISNSKGLSKEGMVKRRSNCLPLSERTSTR
ncbi:MAG: T9SS C-terminal target domain-containing protein [Flavobacterium sp.]|nr:MAG: T9SS C-terminal target domain-containing protein [Flavobacterium sp.]